jgi:hypothetical protein
MKIRIQRNKLEVLDSFEKFVSKGGNILSFADFYVASNHLGNFKPDKHIILLGLCEELAMAGDRNRIFQILNTVFSLERWTLKSFKMFMNGVQDSELLRPLSHAIFDLHENCKNYMKSM